MKILVGSLVTELTTQKPWMTDQPRNEFGSRPCLEGFSWEMAGHGNRHVLYWKKKYFQPESWHGKRIGV